MTEELKIVIDSNGVVIYRQLAYNLCGPIAQLAFLTFVLLRAKPWKRHLAPKQVLMTWKKP
ncbi:MAG: hypothetical protein QXT45_00785 [Candidatus Bilamarchaeaceae archaeon]